MGHLFLVTTNLIVGEHNPVSLTRGLFFFFFFCFFFFVFFFHDRDLPRGPNN